MSVAEKYNEIITLEPKIKLLGVLKDGNIDLNYKDQDEHLDDNITKLSFIQAPHLIEIGNRFSNDLGKLEYISFEYDKLKLFDLPREEKIVTFATTKDVDTEEIVKTVTGLVINSDKGKTHDEENHTMKSSYSNSWQNYMLNCIEFMKEFTITSIQMNEKTLESFWKKFNK